ncbi:MAG: GAF domain-containing protein [Anaerolineae bacterium]|nr:GAF domain-containing protein [Anaerolineae bacterium]
MTTILVVDDDLDTLELATELLQKHNYKVLKATSGKQALPLARSQKPDLILLDIRLPDSDGITICKTLRSAEETASIPVVLATGHEPHKNRADALMAGANDYITKPFDLDDLVRRIKVVLTHEVDTTDQNQRLVDETTYTALAVVPCELAWLLSIDPQKQKLVSQTVATSQGEEASQAFLSQATGEKDQGQIPLSSERSLLTRVALSGISEFNLPLSRVSEFGDFDVYKACDRLGLYFVTIIPLQISGTPLGILVLGSRDIHDTDTEAGQQILTTVASQAATVLQNARLIETLTRREIGSRRERAFRQALLDSMGDGMLVYNTRGIITFVNHRLSRMTGKSLEELVGQPVGNLFASEDQNRIKELLHFEQKKQVETRSFEVNLLRGNENVLPVLAIRSSRTVSTSQQGGEQLGVMVITNLSLQKAREQALKKQTHRLRALSHATQTIASTLSLDETIRTILMEASSVMQAEMASVLLRTTGGDEMVFQAAVGPHAEKLRGQRIPTDYGIAGYVARSGEPVLVTALENDKRFKEQPLSIAGMTKRSAVAAPLIVDGRVIGVVEVVNKNEGTFDRADLEMLEGLTRSAAIAITNVRLYSDAKRHVRELTLLLKTSETASSTLAIEHVLETVALQLVETLSVKWCMISSLDDNNQTIQYQAESADIFWPEGSGHRFTLSQYPAADQSLRNNHPVSLNIGQLENKSERYGQVLPANTTSILVLPIKSEQQIIGLVELCHFSDDSKFVGEDIERCQTITKAWVNALSELIDWKRAVNLRVLSMRLLQTTDAGRCTVFDFDQASKVLIALHQNSSMVWPLGQGPQYKLDTNSLRSVAVAERTPVTAKISEENVFITRQTTLPQMETGSLLITPLIARGEAIGLVELIDTNPDRVFTESDLSLAKATGNVIGNALENARLYSALLRRAAQLEAAYNDLQDADQVKAEWIQNVSHELRTPLTSIIGYTDLIIEGDLGPISNEQRNGLDVISEKSRQLARMVEDLLTIQYMEREPLERVEFPLQEIANAAIGVAQAEARKSGIAIVTQYQPDIPDIAVDVKLIQQVFYNLLDNAIKFTQDGGEIVVAIEDVGMALRSTVSDNGIGIPPEEYDKIWRRFYQVDGSMTRQYGGTGLGLSIVREIIEKHHGRVWVESKLGEGSAFSFILPKTGTDGRTGPEYSRRSQSQLTS